jgi:hypothetical protein
VANEVLRKRRYTNADRVDGKDPEWITLLELVMMHTPPATVQVMLTTRLNFLHLFVLPPPNESNGVPLQLEVVHLVTPLRASLTIPQP